MKLWGGRFEKEPNAAIAAFTNSLPFDQRMWEHDIRGSIAHCRMLGHTGIISADEAQQIEQGLREILAEIPEQLPLTGAEDIHGWVEGRLRAKLGPLAGKLHTARSRNDQVSTDARLYLRDAVASLDAQVVEMQRALVAHAEQHVETVLPGFTHMQHAQPIVLAHHLLAYFWMLQRDRGRLADWRKRANILPLGAGALAGSPYPIDREFVARELGFDGVTENSLDTSADRDFMVELASALATLQMHLSRLAEEVVLWNAKEFGWVTLDDSVATGSSIMPQKKNPDVAELVRGKSGRVFGNLQSLLVTMKGLPLAYNSDMQEDKERIFDSIDTVGGCLGSMTVLLTSCHFRTDRMREATRGDFSTATDLADFLAQRGVPFRTAHEVVGEIVKWCEDQGRVLETLTAAELVQFHAEFAQAPADITSVDASVRSRKSQGGTAPDEVRKQLARAQDVLGTAL